MKSTKLSLAVIALISKTEAQRLPVKAEKSFTFSLDPRLAQVEAPEIAAAKAEAKAPAKKEAKAEKKEEKKTEKKDEKKEEKKEEGKEAKELPKPHPALDLKGLTAKNEHGFVYNSFGPENPYPQRETHGHTNDHYDQRLSQQKGVPVHVNPVIAKDTMGDAKLDMKMVVGPDDIELKKKRALVQSGADPSPMPWTSKVDVTGLTPNQWDDAIHQADGVRSFRDGTPLQYPNWQVGQFYRGQGTPKLDVTGKEVNKWDATVHFANGTRADPDGTKLQWPNWQAPEPASFYRHLMNGNSLATADPKASVNGYQVNSFDGTIHLKDGTRVNPDGSEIQWPNWQPSYQQNVASFNHNGAFAQQRSRADPNPMPWTTKVDVTGQTPNQWDDAIHQADGVRSFRDGTPLQYPNWQVGQFYRDKAPKRLSQKSHKHRAQDWDYVNQKVDVSGKTVNEWDQTVHMDDGTRVHPDGTKVTWPNWQASVLSQVSDGPPAELSGAAPAGAKCVPNAWDGLCHNADGSRTFTDGYPVNGVNSWTQKPQSLYQDDIENEDAAGYSNYISKKNSINRMTPQERYEREMEEQQQPQSLYQDEIGNPDATGFSDYISEKNSVRMSRQERLEQELEDQQLLGRYNTLEGGDPDGNDKYFNGGAWTAGMPESAFSIGDFPKRGELKYAN